MTASEAPEQLRRADEAILEELHDRRLEYVALVASRRGIHLDYAEERCRALAERGLVERATDEVTYRITEKGERSLAAVAEESPGEVTGERATAPATE